MAQNEITLKVAEALSQRDIGQGIARLDPKTMSDLGINERDLIEITGDKKTAAIALPSQTDIGLGVIRIDGLVRFYLNHALNPYTQDEKLYRTCIAV